MSTAFLITGLLRTWVLIRAKDNGVVFGQDIIDTMDQIDHTVSPGTIYPLLNTMVKKGLLRRTPSTWDPRQVHYEITDRGEIALAQAKGFLAGALSDW